MSANDKYKRGYKQGLSDANTKAQSDLDQLKGDPHHAEGYLHGYSEGQQSRTRRGLNK
jgi:hypothetical protein